MARTLPSVGRIYLPGMVRDRELDGQSRRFVVTKIQKPTHIGINRRVASVTIRGSTRPLFREVIDSTSTIVRYESSMYRG